MSARRKDYPRSAGRILQGTLKQLGLHAGLSRHRVVHLWPKIVEPTVARHAKAEKVSGSTLYVIVDSSVWMNELAAIRNLLLEKVNSRLAPDASPITEIRFMQRSWARVPESKTPEPEPPVLGEADRRLVGAMLEPVKDEDLRRMLQRILEKDLALRIRRGAQK
jgi:hypothetical protein